MKMKKLAALLLAAILMMTACGSKTTETMGENAAAESSSEENLERITATPTQKKALLKEYRSIITTYDIANRINIYADYLSLLSQEESKIKTISK